MQSRTLTLIAKTLQNLANVKGQKMLVSKEINDWLDEERPGMMVYLEQISVC